MDASLIRKLFIEYFKNQNHQLVGSASLIPKNDPTLFFTNAGMVPFKNLFTGEETSSYKRAVTVQKCMRVSGKHNDLENVGVTPRHHTFFEMLGNFSFGDYFKENAIKFAWDLLTNTFKIDGEKLWITIFEDDDDAFEIWHNKVGIPAKKIVRMGEKDNFWAMGDTGPCGPCSEIHIDKQAHSGMSVNLKGPLEDPEGYLEIWNLVFMQYERKADGTLLSLPKPSIDTGMGLERLTSVIQGKNSNYDTDLFLPIIDEVSNISKITYGKDQEKDISMRVIADHSRATAFLIADGVMPSNEERGYVLRRIMRRAIRHGVKLGLNDNFMSKTVDCVIKQMADVYPDFNERRNYVLEVVLNEEQRFRETLDKGLRLYREQANSLKEENKSYISGSFAFKLSDTYGFPLDLTEVIAKEDGLSVDIDAFNIEMEKQREMARKAWKGSGETAISSTYQQLRSKGISSEFIGYRHTLFTSRISVLIKDGVIVDKVNDGDTIEFITEQTPFYAESGGQIGDQGRVVLLSQHADGHALHLSKEKKQALEIKIQVFDTQSPVEGITVHYGKVLEGSFKKNDWVRLYVDEKRRDATKRNHTATHLLHSALRNTLGTHVMQRGSLVTSERLRFDFSHFKPLSENEIASVEDWVNSAILSNTELLITTQALQDAIDTGVIGLFGEKYGENVRVVEIPDWSSELCGGTHVNAIGDIGGFKIISETGIQSGVRRIEALTGLNLMAWVRNQDNMIKALSDTLKVGTTEIPKRITKIIEEKKELEKQIETLKAKLLNSSGKQDILSQIKVISGINVLSVKSDIDDPKALRAYIDHLRDSIKSGVVCVGSADKERATILVGVTKDITNKVQANILAKNLSECLGGNGGGKSDFAQVGGKNIDQLDSALSIVFDMVKNLSLNNNE